MGHVQDLACAAIGGHLTESEAVREGPSKTPSPYCALPMPHVKTAIKAPTWPSDVS